MAILDQVFKAAINYHASDIHVVPEEPFLLRLQGDIVKLKSKPLSAKACAQAIEEILTPSQKEVLEGVSQVEFAYDIDGLGRFRGSAMRHSRGLSAVFRVIPPEIPLLANLGLPVIVEKILDNHQGLILVTGATGQGKSTTLAAMVDHLNTHSAHHILTIEDPIEFIHPLKKGVVNQRQLNKDTLSYSNALRSALREDPDVIVIGEMRDLETIAMAVSAAETGHLVIGTLATSSGPKTVDRMIDAYPANQQNQIRAMLSESLRAVVTQRLIRSIEGTRMVLATEVLIGTLPLANLIKDGKTFQISSMMQTGKSSGMQLMDDSIEVLLNEGKISAQSACDFANEPRRFKPYMTKEAA